MIQKQHVIRSAVARNQGDSRVITPSQCSKLRLVVKYNNELQSFCPHTRKYLLVARLRSVINRDCRVNIHLH